MPFRLLPDVFQGLPEAEARDRSWAAACGQDAVGCALGRRVRGGLRGGRLGVGHRQHVARRLARKEHGQHVGRDDGVVIGHLDDAQQGGRDDRRRPHPADALPRPRQARRHPHLPQARHVDEGHQLPVRAYGALGDRERDGRRHARLARRSARRQWRGKDHLPQAAYRRPGAHRGRGRGVEAPQPARLVHRAALAPPPRGLPQQHADQLHPGALPAGPGRRDRQAQEPRARRRGEVLPHRDRPHLGGDWPAAARQADVVRGQEAGAQEGGHAVVPAAGAADAVQAVRDEAGQELRREVQGARVRPGHPPDHLVRDPHAPRRFRRQLRAGARQDQADVGRAAAAAGDLRGVLVQASPDRSRRADQLPGQRHPRRAHAGAQELQGRSRHSLSQRGFCGRDLQRAMGGRGRRCLCRAAS
mmetsp:Transcript_40467/g.94456  ORF Transcript_40467/g.94456 Transcript_40467/m.94456 type:complete len:416 (-) Transcript_40467:40-1287(-)